MQDIIIGIPLYAGAIKKQRSETLCDFESDPAYHIKLMQEARQMYKRKFIIEAYVVESKRLSNIFQLLEKQ